jgi:hypothetical protein
MKALHFPTSAFLLALAAVACPLLAGCASGDGIVRAAVHGKVTVDGQPLQAGHIRFIPIAPEGPAASASVVQGSYEITKPEGPIVGKHRVEVEADSGIPVDDDAAVAKWLSQPHQIPKIPPRYNRESTLVAEVSSQGENVFDVAVTTSQ